MSRFAPLPDLPYYAVIFTNHLAHAPDGYADMASAMAELAQTLPGYLGHESTRDTEGFAITVSYWTTLDAIKAWRHHAKHQIAQQMGRDRWYDHYTVRIAKVERHYEKL